MFWGNGFSGVASDCLSLEASPGFDWRTDGASLFHAEEDQTSFRRMVSLSLSLSLFFFSLSSGSVSPTIVCVLSHRRRRRRRRRRRADLSRGEELCQVRPGE